MISQPVTLDKCSTCNGACCYIFSLPLSRSQMFKRLFSKDSKDREDRLNYLKGIFILIDISKTPLGIEVKHSNNLYSSDHVYKCRMLTKKGKCRIYNHRPYFCHQYTCKSIPQFAHKEYNNKPGLPVLNI